MTENSLYEEAIDYIYSFIDYSLTRNLRNLPEKFNLDRIRLLLEKLNNPQDNYRIFHVAGTKGKGSVSAMISSVLSCSGNNVGLYTSPHLVDFTERIQINGKPITPDELVDCLNLMKPAIAEIEQISMFEITTAMALFYFSQKGVNVAVLEVGLGGRLDATNVVIPDVCVITSISYDHTAVLGNTLEEIALEKAGIIKPGKPVIIAPQKEEARRVFEHVANDRHAALFEVGKDFKFSPESHNLDGQTLRVWSSEIIEGQSAILSIPLLGNHQMENAATAFGALQIGKSLGIHVTDEGLRNGMQKVKWPGRFEILRKSPPVIIDAAHNRDSIMKLRLTFEEYFPGTPIYLVFGAAEDKDIAGMFSEILPFVKRVYFTKSEHPRAANPDQLMKFAQVYEKPMESIVPIEDAIEKCIIEAGSKNAVVITGSVFVAAAAREVWFSHAE